VVNLTRLRRPSSSSFSISDSSKLPLMVNNVVYDMDSATSPSSSDSDSSPVNRPQAPAAKIEVTLIRIVQLVVLFQFNFYPVNLKTNPSC
jgi:hypothetical protein